MSEQKAHENFFKFSLFQESDVIIERVFSADVFNPMARYSVNIKALIPSIIQRLQKLLSKRNVNYRDQYQDKVYDLLGMYQNLVDHDQPNKLTQPQVKKVDIENQDKVVIKTITGVECKFCFYINNHLIVERVFYVDKYNPAVRFSTDIVEKVNEITDDIFHKIKMNDVFNMCDDFELIRVYKFPHINNVRELDKEERILYLKNIKDADFVNMIKSQNKRANKEEVETSEK